VGDNERRCNVFLDGYCSTVQGLLDWFEVDLGFPEPDVGHDELVTCE
jgi:hypothetical protein